MRLGAPLRGAIYGFALIVAVPIAWMAGKWLPALYVATVALVGMGIEGATHVRRDRKGR